MCITTTIRFSTCTHAYLSRAARCTPSQLSHGKFCEGPGAGGMDVAGLCPGCCAPLPGERDTSCVAGGSETGTCSSSSSAAGGVADAGGQGEKKGEMPGPGSCLDDIPGFEMRDVEKWRFGAWGLGRGVGMGVGMGMGMEEGRKPRKLRKARKVLSVKRAKVRMVLEEEEEEGEEV